MGLGTLLIRADASPEIGTGHVMRCLALAQAWQDAGGDAIFVTAQCTSSVRARLAAENCPALPIAVLPGSALDSALTKEAAERYRAKWVAVDSYSFDATYHEQLKRAGRKVLCIDDAGLCDYYVADIVLNQNLNASDGWYRRCASDTQLLLGSQFCLLRREFAAWRDWNRHIPLVASRVMITLGGSVPVHLGVRVIEAIQLVRSEPLTATFIVGGSTRDIASLENCAAESKRVTILKDVSNMAELMSKCDIAVSAAGSTCWELCFLGLPSVLLDVASNQTPVALELERRGCAIYAGPGDGVSASDLANTLETLIRSQATRESLSRNCRQLVDGRGAERVVSAMLGASLRSELLVAGGESN